MRNNYLSIPDAPLRILPGLVWKTPVRSARGQLRSTWEVKEGVTGSPWRKWVPKGWS